MKITFIDVDDFGMVKFTANYEAVNLATVTDLYNVSYDALLVKKMIEDKTLEATISRDLTELHQNNIKRIRDRVISAANELLQSGWEITLKIDE